MMDEKSGKEVKMVVLKNDVPSYFVMTSNTIRFMVAYGLSLTR